MAYKLAELAAWVGGEVRGDGNVLIERALPLDDCQPGSITFVSDTKQLPKLAQCPASAVIAAPTLAVDRPAIIHRDPFAAILEITRRLEPPVDPPVPGISPQAFVHPTARIHPEASIGPFAVVEAYSEIGAKSVIHPHAVVRAGCRLGESVEIHPHAVLYPRTVVGDRTVLHAGVVIGCDGFGYRVVDGKHAKVPQLGNVEIGADVEIGSQSTVDRATIGSTRIGDGTKIDNLVMIGHNCRIGKHNIFVSQAGMAGSCKTGDYVVLAGKAGIADHVSIGTGAVVGAYCGVFQDIEPGAKMLGMPARPERETKRIKLAEAKLPDLVRQVSEIRKRLGLVDKEDASTMREAG